MEIISTLFLLKQTQRESSSGRKFENLRGSIPLWLQLLAVILVTWLLVQPRYVKAKSTQRIAIILDSSASMSVFKQQITTSLIQEIPRLTGAAANIEIWLMESDTTKPKIYQGTSTREMIAALDQWNANSGATDPSNTLRIARSLVGKEGAITYITDTPLDSTPPYNTSILAIGSHVPNCGITGVSFEQRGEDLIWKALVKNYSDSAQQRTWYLEYSQKDQTPRTKDRSLNLKAGQIVTIQGVFPNEAERCQITLSDDAFLLDNTLPLVRPLPKPLHVNSSLPEKLRSIGTRILSSFPNLTEELETNRLDLQLTSTDTTPINHHLIVFPEDRSTSRPYLTGNIVAPKNALTDGLNWQTLLIRDNISLPYSEADTILLWQGERPLIILRQDPVEKHKALIFNFDISQSNALKQPSTAVLLLRFCEQLRHDKIALETRITETDEPLQIAHNKEANSPLLTIRSHSLSGETLDTTTVQRYGSDITAPSQPGFFSITQGETTLFTSATYFADTREADFSLCQSDQIYAATAASAEDRHTREDHYWRIWGFLILAILTVSWWFTSTKSKESRPVST